MTLQSFTTSVRLGACVAALAVAGLAQAQTAHPQPQPPMPEAHPWHVKPVPHTHRYSHPEAHYRTSEQGKARKNHYHNASQHEDAAVRHEERRGKGPTNPHVESMDQFQRNAFRRCEVHRDAESRQACVERVRQPVIHGSVRGGGILREYRTPVQGATY